jgi:hypothetical protein
VSEQGSLTVTLAGLGWFDVADRTSRREWMPREPFWW